jgi:3-hydroxyacyl-[acyl-carrier-protein] dehydratase
MRLPEDWSIWARGLRRNRLWEEGLSTTIGRWGREEIERLLPHRPPSLLLDEIESLDFEQGAARAWRRLDPADPVFSGHFPGDPVYPGILQLEMMGQLGAWLAQRLKGEERAPIRLLKVHHAVFAEPVCPGERVEVLCQLLDDSGMTAIVAGQVRGKRAVASVCALELCRVQP